jgi:hypothetical protein
VRSCRMFVAILRRAENRLRIILARVHKRGRHDDGCDDGCLG